MAAFLPEIMKARLAAGLIFAIIRNEPKIDINSSKGLRNVSKYFITPQILTNMNERNVFFPLLEI